MATSKFNSGKIQYEVSDGLEQDGSTTEQEQVLEAPLVESVTEQAPLVAPLVESVTEQEQVLEAPLGEQAQVSEAPLLQTPVQAVEAPLAAPVVEQAPLAAPVESKEDKTRQEKYELFKCTIDDKDKLIVNSPDGTRGWIFKAFKVRELLMKGVDSANNIEYQNRRTLGSKEHIFSHKGGLAFWFKAGTKKEGDVVDYLDFIEENGTTPDTERDLELIVKYAEEQRIKNMVQNNKKDLSGLKEKLKNI